MDAEMDILYADALSASSPDARAQVDAVLAVDPTAIVATVLAFDGGEAVGHAALRPYGDELEVKKVFVSESHRGRGVARLLMRELEAIALAQGVTSLVLQTGFRQVQAIALYEDIGYQPIPAFNGYGVIPASACYRKILSSTP